MFPMGMVPAVSLTVDPDFVHRWDSSTVQVVETIGMPLLGMLAVVQSQDGDTGLGQIIGIDPGQRVVLILWAITPDRNGPWLKAPPKGKG